MQTLEAFCRCTVANTTSRFSSTPLTIYPLTWSQHDCSWYLDVDVKQVDISNPPGLSSSAYVFWSLLLFCFFFSLFYSFHPFFSKGCGRVDIAQEDFHHDKSLALRWKMASHFKDFSFCLWFYSVVLS